MNKPEAMSALCDRLETAGLYAPPAPFTLDEYTELSARAGALAVSGHLESAQHIRSAIDRHAPEEVKRLQRATGTATQTDRHEAGAKRQLLALYTCPR